MAAGVSQAVLLVQLMASSALLAAEKEQDHIWRERLQKQLGGTADAVTGSGVKDFRCTQSG